MSTFSIITDQGISKSIDLANGEGYRITPYRFAVSDVVGELVKTRTIDDMLSPWFTGLISSASKINANTVQFSCNIPPESFPAPKHTKEVYLIAKDENDQDFLLGIAQPTTELTYDPEGELRIRIRFTVDNINIGDLYQFIYTQANEIEDHNNDILSHPAIQNSLKAHGIFLQEADQKFVGQLVDQFPVTLGDLENNDIVFYNEIAGRYEKSSVLNPEKKRAVGIYNSGNDTVIFGGVFDYPHNEKPYTKIYLSEGVDGQIVFSSSSVCVGHTLSSNKAFVQVKITVESDLIVSPDGDKEVLLLPPIIHELVLKDANGINWEVKVDNKGVLSSEVTVKPTGTPFRLVKPDLSFGHLEISTSGEIYVQIPGNLDYVIDNHHYLASPDLNSWRFSLDMENNIVMQTHDNRYLFSAAPYSMFEIRQLISGRGTLGLPLVTLGDIEQIGQTLPGAGLSNLAIYGSDIEDIQVPVTFSIDREWTALGSVVGDVKESMLNEANFYKLHGNTWAKCDGRNVSNSKYHKITGLVTVPVLTNKYVKIN